MMHIECKIKRLDPWRTLCLCKQLCALVLAMVERNCMFGILSSTLHNYNFEGP